MTLNDIDLLDVEKFGRHFPHEWFTYLREHAPVYKHPEPNGPGFWVVTRFEDVKQVSNDWATFTSDFRHGGSVALVESDILLDGVTLETALSLDLDPPEHTVRRKVLNRAVVPRVINALETQMREYAGELIDSAISRGQVDWGDDVAVPLTIRMICTLLGVPREEEGWVLEWTNRIGMSEDPEFRIEPERLMRTMDDLRDYARNMAEDRRAEPRDDATSILAEAIRDEVWTIDSAVVSFHQLLIAGNETTRNTALHGLEALIDSPEQYAQLVADPSLIPGAVEEMLRWTTALTYFRRTATKDTEIGGTPIRKGDKVVIYYCSANRDERVFKDPFRFDIHRNPNPHVAFGAGGPHFCVGVHLTRLQLRVLFEELVKRVPVAPKLNGPVVRSQTRLLNGIKRMPIDLGVREGLSEQRSHAAGS